VLGVGQDDAPQHRRGLDVPDEGWGSVGGLDPSELGEDGLPALRRDGVGFVFEAFGLIPILTAAANGGVPMRLRRADVRECEERVELLLALVGLADQAGPRPGELSGGQDLGVPSGPQGTGGGSPPPGPSPTAPRSSSPTSRPVGWTPRPVTPSWSCCGPSSTAKTSPLWSPPTIVEHWAGAASEFRQIRSSGRSRDLLSRLLAVGSTLRRQQ